MLHQKLPVIEVFHRPKWPQVSNQSSLEMEAPTSLIIGREHNRLAALRETFRKKRETELIFIFYFVVDHFQFTNWFGEFYFIFFK